MEMRTIYCETRIKAFKKEFILIIENYLIFSAFFIMIIFTYFIDFIVLKLI